MRVNMIEKPFGTEIQSAKQSGNAPYQKIKESLRRIAKHVGELSLETIELFTGETLFNQGQEGDCMYFILSGQLDVRIRQSDGSEHLVSVLKEGAIVGELSVLSGQNRTATVSAIENTRLLRITEKDISKLLKYDSLLFDNIGKIAAERWKSQHFMESLKDLFGDLPKEMWHELEDNLEWRYLSNGDVLFKEGDTADGMYIVVKGRLRAMVKTDDGSEHSIGEIGPSEVVGEYALLTDEPRSSTVYAVRESSLARISIALFDKCVSKYPQMMRNIARIMVSRQKKMLQDEDMKSPDRITFALIQASPNIDIYSFAKKLSESLSTFGASLIIDSKKFDESFGRTGAAYTSVDDPIQPAIVAKLNEFEESNRYVLFLTDDINSSWTRRAIGQADRILIVADSQQDPDPLEIERIPDELAIPVRTDLILLHPANTDNPIGTSAWLDKRNVRTHYHIRLGDNGHMDRLARRISGHAIGLVFSGGAAKGYAHMGVFKALLEVGIPLDYIAGTSMGAIMAGPIANGFTYEKYEEFAKWFADLGVSDYTLPYAALNTSDHVTQICTKAFEDRLIEDLWIPFFCISTNLSRAEKKIHQRGFLWRAVRSSMSIPGLFLPVLDNGELLVDGGIIENYPIKSMRNIAESNRIIGVNISPHREKYFNFDYDTSISGWRIFLNRLNPFSKNIRIPSITDILLRSFVINNKRNSIDQESLEDLTIYPDTRGFSMSDYNKWREIAQCGYDKAIEPLQKWKERQPDLLD